MRTTCRPAKLGAFLALVVTSWSALPAAGQETHASTQHLRFVHHDVSPRLRVMPPIAEKEERRVIPPPLIYPGHPSGPADPVLQSSSVSSPFLTTSRLNFALSGQGASGMTVHAAPPDP